MAVDVETKQIVAMEVTDERTGYGRVLKPLMKKAEEHCMVVRAIADGAYDSRKNFAFLAEKGIEPPIKVRKNASGRSQGCHTRKRVALEYPREPEP